MRFWIARGRDGAQLGMLQVERTIWNDDDAAPIALPGLLPAVRSVDAYRYLLAPAGAFAHELGSGDLRVLAWDRETELQQLLADLAGWHATGVDVDLGLDLATPGPADVPAPDGFSITTRAERPDLDESAYECARLGALDIPGDERIVFPDFPQWLAVVNGPLARRESTFLAVDDATGQVAGVAELEYNELSKDVVWNGFTVVHPSFRRRGIATALKANVIAYARSAGFQLLRTENEARNAAMQSINRRLGYRPIAERTMWRGPAAALREQD